MHAYIRLALWTLGCTSPICLKLCLRGGYRTVAVFHPLKHTHWLAGRVGLLREKGKDRQKRQLEECFSSHTLQHVSPVSLTVFTAPLADVEHSENRLRLCYSYLPGVMCLYFPQITPRPAKWDWNSVPRTQQRYWDASASERGLVL